MGAQKTDVVADKSMTGAMANSDVSTMHHGGLQRHGEPLV